MLSCRVDVVIVLEFCEWEEVCPVVLPLVDEDLEVLLQLLVDSFSLAITLWVVGSGGGELNPKHSVEFPSEFGYKLWSAVRYDLARESMVFPDMLKEEASSSSSRDSGERGYEVGSLGDRVHYHHHCVIAC